MATLRQKLLLMGKSGTGKTSMRSIIFANYVPRDTKGLGPTIDVEHSNIRFLGNLSLSLWDCGGQDMFMDNFLEAEQENVFKNVAVLIYVFSVDCIEAKDFEYFEKVCRAINENSPDALVFCLVHKMDLIPEERRDKTFEDTQDRLRAIGSRLQLRCFRTSIWDETLYKAWSSIVCSLVPNVAKLGVRLRSLCELCEADEVVIFERATFLVIGHAVLVPHDDVHRFEKISNIIKQFKLSCNKSRATLDSLQVENANSTVLIVGLTQYTTVMLILSDMCISPGIVLLNIELARQSFEPLLDGQLS